MGIFNIDPMILVVRVIIICTTLPIHEYAHGWMAHKLGDDTAISQGRLDLNPIRHIDPFGAILLLLTGFGWAKPVPVNPTRFSRKVSMRGGMALTALAGPVANILLALAIMLLLKLLLFVAAIASAASQMIYIALYILQLMISLNVSLAVFNLLPVPPLDGYNVLSYFLPGKITYTIARYSSFIFIALLLVLSYTNVLTVPISFFTNIIYTLLDKVTFFMDLLLKLV